MDQPTVPPTLLFGGGEDFYVHDNSPSDSPPLSPCRSPGRSPAVSSVGSPSSSPRAVPTVVAAVDRRSLDLDLAASPEATLNLSFSPRSSGKLSAKGRRKSRKRNGKKDKNKDKNGGSEILARSESGSSYSHLSASLGGRVLGVPYVLPAALADKVASGTVDLSDWHVVHDLMKKLSRVEYKAIVKSTRLPRTWAEKLQLFPAATSYFAYAKNRYRDVLADERTRVKLVGRDGDDYVNANHIAGSEMPGAPRTRYIACQAPLPTTVDDFWSMVWQERSSVIVMLTRLREKGVAKAHPYWPKDGDDVLECGAMRVALVTQKSFPGICINTLRVAQGNESRIVYHLFYTEWPDFGVPSSTRALRHLVTYTNLYCDLAASQGVAVGPIICHCSAGIGRTGTFIAVHASLTLMEAGVTPDVAGIVTAMRRSRSQMVQTDAQYLFVYEALNDHIHQHMADFKKPVRGLSASALLESCVNKGSGGHHGSSALRTRSISVVVESEVVAARSAGAAAGGGGGGDDDDDGVVGVSRNSATGGAGGGASGGGGGSARGRKLKHGGNNNNA